MERLSGTDGSTVWKHQQSILAISGSARDLTVLSDGRLGFTFDGRTATSAARVGFEFLEAANGVIAGSASVNTTAGGKAFVEGAAPTSRGTFISSVAVGNNNFALDEISRDGTIRNLDFVVGTNKSLEVDKAGQLFFTQSQVPSLQRRPNGATVGTPSQIFDLNIDNKDQITLALSKKIIKIRQRAQAVGDTFNRPIASGKIVVSAPGVLRNDAGLTGSVIQLVSPPSKGTLTLNANGSFDYIPGATFAGTDSFQYRLAKDGITGVATATINELKLLEHNLAATVFGGDDVHGTLIFNVAPDPDLILDVTDNSSAVISPGLAPIGGLGNLTARAYTLKTAVVAANVDVTVTAKVSSITSTRILQVRPGGIQSLTALRTILISGEGTVGIIRLTGPRPGTAIVTSSNSSLLGSPGLVQLSGESQTAFLISTTKSTTGGSVILTATVGATSQTLAFQVAAMPRISSVEGFAHVVGGDTLVLFVQLDKVTPYDLPCTVSRLPDSPFLTVPATVTVLRNKDLRSFDVTTVQVGATKNFTVSVSGGGATKTKNVTILINPLQSITLGPSTVVGGTSSTGTVHFSNLAPPEGTQVTLQHSGSDIDMPSTVRVEGGAWSASFQILTKPVSQTGTRTIFAKLGTVTKSATLTVNK